MPAPWEVDKDAGEVVRVVGIETPKHRGLQA